MMNFRDIDENMDVKLKEDYKSNNTFIKKGSKGKVKSLLIFGFVSVRFGEIEVVCNPRRLEKYEGGTTMNEKDVSNYCADSQLEKQVKELQHTVNVLQKDLNNAHDIIEDLQGDTKHYHEEWKELNVRTERLEMQAHDHEGLPVEEEMVTPIPELTETEDHILWLVSEDYEWVAKDPADDAVCVFTEKPTYDKQFREWTCENETDFKTINLDDVAEFANLPTSQPFKIADLIKEG